MRLLEWSGNGQLRLTRDLPPDQIPKYAILSHTWGPDEEEVTFEDLKNNLGKDKSGYEKIRFCGKQARRDGLQFFWVDTCCIDKTNNAELAEAINSMFRWYRDADKCYVYLSDVSTMGHDRVRLSLQSWQPAFIGSRWFTRGWTLQELIAPLSVEFFDSNGQRLGDKQSLERQLHDITGIATSALQGAPLSGFSVKDKMSWTANRQTKRAEDRAYSLLGIFDVSMATIYGEGAEKAFERLRNELYTRSKTRQLSELSSVSDTFTPTNRHKSLDTSLYSVPSHLAPNFANNEPSSTLQFPIYSENLEDTRTETNTSINHGIDAATKRLLINQFYFTKIDERLTNLTAAQGTTCRWFLAKAEYISWHDPTAQSDHGGFLWIKGNPGTGKSTLMKFLFEETKLNTKHDSSQITLSFFFLAQAIGLYRSSLHQLFEKAVDLEDSLEWMTTDGARVILRNGWHEGALKQTLLHAVEKLGNRSLTIFIDALDECRQNQVTDMICFFEELCNCAKEKEVRLKICFSSRHYPTVVIQRGIEVTLEDETGHIEDIKQYIESKSRLGKSKQAESLRSEILEKSSNIFLWVVLVLDILNSEYAHNTISLKKMRECLKEIPAKLTDLFEMILVQHGDNLEQLHVCLKLILFAARPLKPQELYFAINLSLDKEFSGYWDQEDVELDQIKTFVRSSSKGLAEITRNKASEVQFIHESVRDALLGQYQGQLLETSNNLVGYSHELLRDSCLSQLHAFINQACQYVEIPNHLPLASELSQLRDTITLKLPFLEYSVSNVLYHANYAQHNSLDQKEFLTNFPFQKWIFLNNALERYHVRRYTKSASPLYILAENNLADLIHIHPQRHSYLEIEAERYGLPLFAAMALGNHEAVIAFLEAEIEMQPQTPLLRHLCQQYSENKGRGTSFSRDFAFSQASSIFIELAKSGSEKILDFLCVSGKLDVKSGVEAKDETGNTPLIWAVQRGHEAVVDFLLNKGADTEPKDKNGNTALIHAAYKGHETIVNLLLKNGANTESKNKENWTPLMYAAYKGHKIIVDILLKNGAGINSKEVHGCTPLMIAADWGHEAIVNLLLEKGADIESKDENGCTALMYAVDRGHEAIVGSLLKKGANVTCESNKGHTALSLAKEMRHRRIVKILLQKLGNA